MLRVPSRLGILKLGFLVEEGAVCLRRDADGAASGPPRIAANIGCEPLESKSGAVSRRDQPAGSRLHFSRRPSPSRTCPIQSHGLVGVGRRRGSSLALKLRRGGRVVCQVAAGARARVAYTDFFSEPSSRASVTDRAPSVMGRERTRVHGLASPSKAPPAAPMLVRIRGLSSHSANGPRASLSAAPVGNPPCSIELSPRSLPLCRTALGRTSAECGAAGPNFESTSRQGGLGSIGSGPRTAAPACRTWWQAEEAQQAAARGQRRSG